LVTRPPFLVTSWRDRFFETRPWSDAGNVVLGAAMFQVGTI
jgi:hypothetical protein